jgi:PIN domain nuclease of toxin-antitoxin system
VASGNLNLDTHIFVRALTDQLSPREVELLAGMPWGISAMVLWEIVKLAQRGRIQLNLSSPELVAVLAEITIWPVDEAVCRAAATLDIQSDPADELIAATSIAHGVPLVTRDAKLRQSRMVPLAM